MINRENWELVQAYLKYQLEVKQNEALTGRSQWCRLRHVLEWADERSLTRAPTIRPTFPAYLEEQERHSRRFSAQYLTSVYKTARAFFSWAKAAHPNKFRKLGGDWIETIRASRARGEQAELERRELYTVEEVIRLATFKAETLAQRRLAAGVALMFISGMRIGALVTLPIECVDLDGMRIYQLPGKGVRTKNRKAAVTSLLNVPDLVTVAREWDTLVRGRLAKDSLWWAQLTQMGELRDAKAEENTINRRVDFNDELKELCGRAGVPYKSSHKLRHGFAVFALKRARTMEELKAISQNLMHSTIGITDGIYGRLMEDDVHEVISRLSGQEAKGESDLQRMVDAAVARAMGKG